MGEGEERVFLFPISLEYQFTLENTSRKKIGSRERPVLISIEQESDLIPEAYLLEDSRLKLGGGYSGRVEISEDEVVEINISYHLNWVSDSRSISLAQYPTQEQLNEIESKALDAILVITEGERELMRIDLREYKD